MSFGNSVSTGLVVVLAAVGAGSWAAVANGVVDESFVTLCAGVDVVLLVIVAASRIVDGCDPGR